MHHHAWLEQFSRELKIQKKHKKKYEVRAKDILVESSFGFCHLILTEGFTVYVSKLGETHDPPTSGVPNAEITN